MITIQEINFPDDCNVIHNDFYTYDPENEFTEANSLAYLNEDLLQCFFPEHNAIIDLGWYGDIKSNQGEFKVQIIQNENWEFPLSAKYSKSVEEIRSILKKILHYYSKVKTEDLASQIEVD